MDILFPFGTSAHWVGTIGFVITIWLGAYLATHSPRSFPSRLAIFSLFALSGYFLHVVLCIFLPAEQAGHLWRRFMGWFALLPLPIWFHLTASLLPPEQRSSQGFIVRLAYAVCGILSFIWIFGDWQFSRETLLPPELVLPITLFVIAMGSLALINVRELHRKAADQVLRHRYTLLGIVVLFQVAGLLYWPVLVNWLQVSWTPPVRLALGDGILVTGTAVLAYAVAFHNAFMAGHWLRRDFFFHAATVVTIAALYLLMMLAAWKFAEAFGFDVPTLVLITVVGLAILTHLLTIPARQWWDRLFFRQLRALPDEIGGLVNDTSMSADQLEEQMTALVNRLQELTGASTTCIALREGDRLIVRASTDSQRIGHSVPMSSSLIGATPIIGPQATNHDNQERHGGLWDCLVLSEPILINKRTVGYLLLGERGVGEGYDRQEGVWVSTLAAYLGAMLERTRWRTLTERRIAELSAEAEALSVQEQSLKRDFAAALAGPPGIVSRRELREAIYAYSRPDRLKAIISRKESTLAALPSISESEMQPAQALQQQLALALENLEPPDGLPSLESLRDRPVRNKRRRHLPTSVANYYTLRLVMTGYTHETIAEMLEVSPRQVRNYLNHALGAVKTFLEHGDQRFHVKIA